LVQSNKNSSSEKADKQYETIISQFETIMGRLNDFDRRLKLIENSSLNGNNQTEQPLIDVNPTEDPLQF
jgi:hypothetical protein